MIRIHIIIDCGHYKSLLTAFLNKFEIKILEHGQLKNANFYQLSPLPGDKTADCENYSLSISITQRGNIYTL